MPGTRNRGRMAITPTKARKIFEAFCNMVDETPHEQAYVTQGCDQPIWDQCGPVLCRDIEDRGTFGIAWEGWLSEVPQAFWDRLQTKFPDIWIEKGGSWYVTIWPFD